MATTKTEPPPALYYVAGFNPFQPLTRLAEIAYFTPKVLPTKAPVDSRMESSVAELLDVLNRLEDATNTQMNELASVRQETLSVKWKLSRYGEKSKEIESALNSSRELLSSKQFELMLLEHREKTLKEEMLPEKLKVLETEKANLEQLHCHIWQARRDFCDKAKELNQKDGFLSSTCQSNEEGAVEPTHPELLPKATDEELDLLVAEIASLETDLIKMNGDVFTLNEKIESATNEIEMLTNEPTTGTDFIRLQEARDYSQNQVDLMESRCKKVQDEINSNEKKMQALSLERRATEAMYHDYANDARNKYTNHSNQNITQTFSAKKFGAAKLAEGLNNVGLETKRPEMQESLAQFRRKTPSKVTFASTDQCIADKESTHTEKLLMRAENRMKEMQAARDAFLKMKGEAGKTLKTGVTAEWLQTRPALPKASVTDNLALRNTEIPKKLSFVPKQQSGVASKLGTANKTSLSYDTKVSTGNIRNKPPPPTSTTTASLKPAQLIPARPSRDEDMELESSVDPATHSTDKFEQPKLAATSARPSILKPSRMPYIS